MTEAGVWSTRGLAQAAAFDAWTEKMSELHLAWSLSFPKQERFEAAVRYRRLDTLTIADFRGGRFAGRRPSASQPGSERLVGVLMNLSGRLVCRYAGEELVVSPNDLLVWDSELAEGFDGVEPHREVSLLLPRERVPEGLADGASGFTSAVCAGAGSGLVAVAAHQLQAIARELDHLDDAGLAITCQAFFDTLDAALAPARQRPARRARKSLLVRLRQYIEDNLDDPGLYASSIAAAHGISVRTVHLAFAGTGTTVSRWIRDRRLRVCYRELARGGAHQTVTDIAFRWGFNDMAHFSRTFKQAFGVTPSGVLSRGYVGDLPPKPAAPARKRR